MEEGKQMNIWQEAVNRELIRAELGVVSEATSLEQAERILSELIQWYIDVAINPDCNGGYSLQPCDEFDDDWEWDYD